MLSSDDADKLIADIEEGFKEEQRKTEPSPTIGVYCDKHLGVNMVRAKSWVTSEYGESKSDVNSLEFWRCPKTGCGRCYEPTMYGYVWYASEMGSRIEPNPSKQFRCNHHSGLPFMYVGKIGEGRKYLCPFYKCSEEGDEVATLVVEEHIAIHKDPLEGLGRSEKQQVDEMTTFKLFVPASGLAIDEGSTSNGNRKNPDIRCTISGKLHWFELGQIIDPEVAEKINPKRRKEDAGFSVDQENPFLGIVTKKATRTYETEGAPVELILHFDLRLGSERVVRRLTEKHRGLLETLVTQGPFTRVWIFDEWKKAIVWSGKRKD